MARSCDDPIEMSNTHENAIATLNALPGYRAQFEYGLRTSHHIRQLSLGPVYEGGPNRAV
jgi:hypothetical protein